jgi:hypothetical protein
MMYKYLLGFSLIHSEYNSKDDTWNYVLIISERVSVNWSIKV